MRLLKLAYETYCLTRRYFCRTRMLRLAALNKRLSTGNPRWLSFFTSRASVLVAHCKFPRMSGSRFLYSRSYAGAMDSRAAGRPSSEPNPPPRGTFVGRKRSRRSRPRASPQVTHQRPASAVAVCKPSGSEDTCTGTASGGVCFGGYLWASAPIGRTGSAADFAAQSIINVSAPCMLTGNTDPAQRGTPWATNYTSHAPGNG